MRMLDVGNTFILLVCIFTRVDAAQTTEHLELEDPRPTEAPPFDPKRDNFTLAGLNAKKWEGPYYQEAMLGSVIYLPCALTPQMTSRLYRQRKMAAQESYYWSIVWAHQNWDTVVDPWLGDGRRSYDILQVVPYWKPDMNVQLEQARLTILDANPTDNGIYACVVAMYPPEKGLSPVILSQADLVSIHFLRIKSAYTMGPDCKDKDPEENVYCQTGFEAWTENVFYPSGWAKGDVLFQQECNVDIFLTALTLGGVDPTFWSIGWRFVPLHATDDTAAVEMDNKLEMNFQAPVHLCHPGSIVPCSYNDDKQRGEPEIGDRDLVLAQRQAGNFWKARWLVLTGTTPQASGKWQCWVQGLGMTTHPKTTSIQIRWFVDEIHVKILTEDGLYTWWTTVEFWRVLGLVSAPTIFLLIGLIMAVGRAAAYLHPEKIPPKKHIKLLLEPASESQTAGSAQDGADTFDPYVYMNQFLNKQGVQSYHVAGGRRSHRMLFR
ncbi:hypothetical protein X801_00001 [Opisthorchis viverrini]|uniref:Uncharacterized protein n=2 Tax=Opisthorchis viverrini TaxID=6198 RepID=A0A1S8XBM4_OPIVI|nr:hypothetical protein T265_04577 [Opisthorchis viverrini]KER28624.1 hypothetical protein T265_04577 [Opisthorchis viverrini]OON24072.1 hypothetical protein X801_00001 [Opisthorchis viverrini]